MQKTQPDIEEKMHQNTVQEAELNSIPKETQSDSTDSNPNELYLLLPITQRKEVRSRINHPIYK